MRPADSGYLFIDTAVYSKNRCFRLHLSSKAGKNSVLLPTRRFKCKEMSEEDVFMLSLICNVEAECEKLLTCNIDIGFINVLKYDTEHNKDWDEDDNWWMSAETTALEIERSYYGQT
ncbi:hypothetical protein Tco_0810737 [Tanacetum coccineum]